MPKSVHRVQRFAEASARVRRLAVLGEDDPDAEPLKVALLQARIHSRVRPVGERLDLCLQYIARVKKQSLEHRSRCEQPKKSSSRWRRSWPMGFAIRRFCVQKHQNILQHLQDQATHTKIWRWFHTRRLRDCDQREPELVGVPQMDKF